MNGPGLLGQNLALFLQAGVDAPELCLKLSRDQRTAPTMRNGLATHHQTAKRLDTARVDQVRVRASRARQHRVV